MAETFTTKEDGLKRAQEIAKDGIEKGEIPSLKEVLTKLFQIPDIKFTDEELAILKSIKEQVTAIRDESSNERMVLADELRGNIISQTIKSKDGASIELLTLGTKSENIKKAEFLLTISIMEKLEGLNLTPQQKENISIGIIARILNGNILELLGNLATNGLFEIGKLGKDQIIQKAQQVIVPYFGLGEAQPSKGDAQNSGFIMKLKQVIHSELTPIIDLVQKNKDNLPQIEGFLSNPEAISKYKSGDIVTGDTFKKPSQESLTHFISDINIKIKGLDTEASRVNEIKETVLDFISQGGEVVEKISKSILETLLGLPFIGPILAGLLGYNSEKEALDGFFGKELKRKKSLNALKSNKENIILLKGKKIDGLNSKQFEKLFDYCDAKKIDYSKADFWKKLFDGVIITPGQELSPEDSQLKLLNEALKLKDAKSDFTLSGEPTPTFIDKVNTLGSQIIVPSKVSAESKIDMDAKKRELEDKIKVIDRDLLGITSRKSKVEENSNFLSRFETSSLKLKIFDLEALKKVKLSDMLKGDNEWYGHVEGAVDGKGDWWNQLWSEYDSVRIKPEMDGLRSILRLIKDETIFPKKDTILALFEGKDFSIITLGDFFNKLPEIRKLFSDRFAELIKEEEGKIEVKGKLQADLAKITGEVQRSTEIGSRKSEILTAISDEKSFKIEGKRTIISIGSGKEMIIDLGAQKITIGGVILSIKIEGTSFADGIFSLKRYGNEIQIVFSKVGYAVPGTDNVIKQNIGDFVGLIYELETNKKYSIAGKDGATLNIS